MNFNFTFKITKKNKAKSHQIMGQGPTIQTWGNWTQVINIGKLFENNNLTLIPKPSLHPHRKTNRGLTEVNRAN